MQPTNCHSPEFDQFTGQGFVLVKGVVDGAGCARLSENLKCAATGAGSRNLLAHEWCVALANSLHANFGVGARLPSDAVAVQCTYFDKGPDKNWLVGLHQDLSIPVVEHIDHTELRGWSEKEGMLFVQPPVSVLELLIAVRVHVDDAGAENGALRVVPGSHAFGRLTTVQAEQLKKERGEQVVEAPRGSALIMRPLLLHASSKALRPVPRRVLHFVFGPPQLPWGLRWKVAA
jgi:hypothetical protein